MSSVSTSQPARHAVGTRPFADGARELLLFALAYLTYFGVRALTEGDVLQAVANASAIADAERAAGLAWERGLQSLVLGDELLVRLANWVYVFGHWPVLIVAGLLLFHLKRHHYTILRNTCLLSGAIGLVVFAVFPVAPPRLANLGMVDTVLQHTRGYRSVLPPSLVNEYAAMPSFHAGWNVVLGIVVFGATRNRFLRLLAIAGPVAMVAAVVLTANHFVVDVVAGTTICLLALHVVRRRVGAPAARTLDGDVRHGDQVPRRVRAVDAAGAARRRPRRGQRPPSCANGAPGRGARRRS